MPGGTPLHHDHERLLLWAEAVLLPRRAQLPQGLCERVMHKTHLLEVARVHPVGAEGCLEERLQAIIDSASPDSDLEVAALVELLQALRESSGQPPRVSEVLGGGPEPPWAAPMSTTQDHMHHASAHS